MTFWLIVRLIRWQVLRNCACGRPAVDSLQRHTEDTFWTATFIACLQSPDTGCVLCLPPAAAVFNVIYLSVLKAKPPVLWPDLSQFPHPVASQKLSI